MSNEILTVSSDSFSSKEIQVGIARGLQGHLIGDCKGIQLEIAREFKWGLERNSAGD